MRNPEDHWLTVDQTATALHLSTHHVHRHVRAGTIPNAMLGSVRVIPREWVDGAVATRTVAASRTRIDWAAAWATYTSSSNDSSTHNNTHNPGAEHALMPLPAPAG
jgi:excisionase family DNA binding protein